MTFQLMIVALVLIAICIELLFLTLAVIRVAKATERVGRILDRPRKARAELQDELDQIAQAAASGAATSEDMKRADVLSEDESRASRPRRANCVHDLPGRSLRAVHPRGGGTGSEQAIPERGLRRDTGAHDRADSVSTRSEIEPETAASRGRLIPFGQCPLRSNRPLLVPD